MEVEPFQIEFDYEIIDIFSQLGVSIVFSTYQAGRLMVIGSEDGETLYQMPVPFKKPMGIAIKDEKMAIATLDDIQFLARNEHIAEQRLINKNKFDTYYVSRAIYNTSSLDVHDIGFGENKLWGVNTVFSCLSTFDVVENFVFKWKPDFIDELVPEDRCHLNGMAMRDGLPRYVTALSATNTKDGWRADIMNSGVLLEVPSSKKILTGVAMPHSPRFYKDELFVLASGSGELLKVDTENCNSEVYHNFGKFVRGLCFAENYAFIGVSRIRESSSSFNSLKVKENSNNAGIIVFDMVAKKVVGEIKYINTVEEIFDVQVMPNAKKPAIISAADSRSKEVIVFANQVFWRKPKED